MIASECEVTNLFLFVSEFVVSVCRRRETNENKLAWKILNNCCGFCRSFRHLVWPGFSPRYLPLRQSSASTASVTQFSPISKSNLNPSRDSLAPRLPIPTAISTNWIRTDFHFAINPIRIRPINNPMNALVHVLFFLLFVYCLVSFFLCYLWCFVCLT